MFIITNDRQKILEAMERQFVVSLGIGNLVREFDGRGQTVALVGARKRRQQSPRFEVKNPAVRRKQSMEAVKITPMMQQYLQIKESYRDAILFFRLGDFYEMFFEDAHTASKILDIALTSRSRSEE